MDKDLSLFFQIKIIELKNKPSAATSQAGSPEGPPRAAEGLTVAVCQRRLELQPRPQLPPAGVSSHVSWPASGLSSRREHGALSYLLGAVTGMLLCFHPAAPSPGHSLTPQTRPLIL